MDKHPAPAQRQGMEYPPSLTNTHNHSCARSRTPPPSPPPHRSHIGSCTPPPSTGSLHSSAVSCCLVGAGSLSIARALHGFAWHASQALYEKISAPFYQPRPGIPSIPALHNEPASKYYLVAGFRFILLSLEPVDLVNFS